MAGYWQSRGGEGSVEHPARPSGHQALKDKFFRDTFFQKVEEVEVEEVESCTGGGGESRLPTFGPTEGEEGRPGLGSGRFSDLFRMGNVLEVNALKNDIGLIAKTYFFVIPDTLLD